MTTTRTRTGDSELMAVAKRRYTTVDGRNDWVVTASYDESGLDRAQWFEARISAENERTGEKANFPRELKTYRIGEIEHNFREFVALDWAGDRDAAVDHHLGTIFRRVYSFIERGH